MSVFYIVTNGHKLYLCPEAAAEGQFQVAEGTLSEQCECGRDLAETGTLYGIPGEERGASVLCDQLEGGCETSYVVRS